MNQADSSAQNATTKTRRFTGRIRGGGGGPHLDGPKLLLAMSILFIITGVLFLFRANAVSDDVTLAVETAYPVVPVSTIVDASETDGVISVGLPADAASTTPAVVQFTPTGFPVGVTAPEDGSYKASFYVSEQAAVSLAADLTSAGVQVWFAPAPLRNTSGVSLRYVTPPGVGGAGGATAVPGAQQGSEFTLPATTARRESPGDWLLSVGLLLIVFGAGGAVASQIWSRRLRAREGAAQDEDTVPATTFADVAGCDEAVEQMRELVDFLNTPEKFERIGAKVPTGALLTGPPGTGKTLLARALAGETGVPLFTATGSDFVEMFVGVGPKRIRALFAKARKHPKSIIFIDEIDAVARKRGGGEGNNGSQESENTLNALLTEMDGFHKGNTVVVIAATNRPDILDPALTRPGRLERKIEVPLPDRRGREHILGVHAQGIPLAAEVSLEILARRTPGFSGAQLESVLNEAAIEAVRRGLDEVTSPCVDAAVAMVAMGRARTSAVVTQHDREITAWHEAGHLVCALLLEDADIPVAMSITPRGPAGGVTWLSEGDDLFMTRKKAHARMVTAMGGRAGEQLLLDGEYTQGAAGDIQSATNIALNMAVRFGMTRLGLADRSQHLGGPNAKEVADVVEELLSAALAEATDILALHQELVEAYVEAVLEFGDLDRSDIELIAARFGIVPQGTPTPLTPLPKHASRPGVRNEESAAGSIPVVSRAPERVRFRQGRVSVLMSRLRGKRASS